MNGDAVQVGVARLASPVGERDHVRGPASASVTLVEYGDYECPYCRAAVAIVEELQRVLPDDLRFVFRHFPLENLHPHARRAAEAAEAAASQGKFFEMHAAAVRAPGGARRRGPAAVRRRTRSGHRTNSGPSSVPTRTRTGSTRTSWKASAAASGERRRSTWTMFAMTGSSASANSSR